MKRILVIGATGRVGREVIAQLRGTDTQVRALYRNPNAAVAKGSAEVEVVRGDLTLPETLDECLEGVDSVFLVWCAASATIQPVIERIAKHARRIVFLTSPHQHPHPFFQGAQPNLLSQLHAELERQIRVSGMEWTFLRPGMFAANALWWWAGQIRAGDVVRWPHATAPTAPIDERDIASVAVRALLDEDRAGAEYLITGPESLSQGDQVAIIGEALGSPVRLEEITPEQWLSELPEFVPAPVATMLLKVWAAAIGYPALVTNTVAQVTGVPPRTFREWATRHRGAFQPGGVG